MDGVVTYTIDYGYDAGGKLVSAGDASSQYLYTYDANGHLDVVTESGSGLGAVYTFDYDANVAGDIVAVTVSVNGSVDHVENYTYDAQRRMTQVLQSGASVAAKRVDIAYVDNRVGTLTRYADLSGTTLRGWPDGRQRPDDPDLTRRRALGPWSPTLRACDRRTTRRLFCPS